jgi:TolB-like protein/Tfp pilus assembly protein PilF
LTNEGLEVPSSKEIQTRGKDELKSVAVLPFINMSTDPENEYFSDGITEELLNVLAKIEGLQVTARTSSFAFKGRNEDIKQIGTMLGAKTILEGSVRKAGNRVRITAQLVNASDGYHIWSETYDRQLDDIFEIQDEISLKITNKLREKLTLKPEKKTFVKSPTQNFEAYNVYLKGLFHSYNWTEEQAEIAINEFQKAIDIQPDFALPYTGLANVYIYLGASGKRPSQEVYPKAKEYAEKALKLDNLAAESHCALAQVAFYNEWKWDEVFLSLEKAIELNPNLAIAYLLKAMCLGIHGKYDDAIETMQKSIQLDPFSSPGNFAYAAILTFAGHLNQASNQLDKLFEINPNFPDALSLKGWVLKMLGQYEEARELFKRVQQVPGFESHAYANLGCLYVVMNQPDKAKEYLEKLLTIEKTNLDQTVYFDLATLYGELGDIDKMFFYLNKSVEVKEIHMIYLLGYSDLKKYQSDPRFNELVKKIGLSK